MSLKLYFLIFFFLFCGNLFAQVDKSSETVKNYTINGYVKDQYSGETLIGATVSINGNKKGVTTNTYGFFSITLKEGDYSLLISFVGYSSNLIQLKLRTSCSLDFLRKTGINFYSSQSAVSEYQLLISIPFSFCHIKFSRRLSTMSVLSRGRPNSDKSLIRWVCCV
jgi:hypothetical protein